MRNYLNKLTKVLQFKKTNNARLVFSRRIDWHYHFFEIAKFLLICLNNFAKQLESQKEKTRVIFFSLGQ